MFEFETKIHVSFCLIDSTISKPKKIPYSLSGSASYYKSSSFDKPYPR